MIRSAAQLGLVGDPEHWFQFQQDRNETTHMYKLIVLERVYQRVPAFIDLVDSFLKEVEIYLESERLA